MYQNFIILDVQYLQYSYVFSQT